MAALGTTLAVGKAALFIKNNLKPLLLILLSIIIIVIFFIIGVISSIMMFFGINNNLNFSIINGAEMYGEGLGVLSEEYESNGNPAIIANNKGDIGGKSYGAWQIASKVGSMKNFLNWLSKKDNIMFQRLNNAKIYDGGYGITFDNEWRLLAAENRDYFYQIQWFFIKELYYDPVVSHYKTNNIIDITSRSFALQNVVWSVAVQHGVGGAKNLFNTTNLKADDRTIIIALYNERMKVDKYFSSSSEGIKVSVYNRFIKEKSQALSMLDYELNKLNDTEGENNEN